MPYANQPTPESSNPFTALMALALAHARKYHAATPALSPDEATLLDSTHPGPGPSVDVPALHALGIRVIPWTTNDPARMRSLIALGVDGVISDRPDVLQQALAEARAVSHTIPDSFDVQGHRGARGLRPENTLPAFEAGLDNLVTTIETDTGVTCDLHSVIWHDQFLNPESCRRADDRPYDYPDAVFHRDQDLADLQRTFVCDRLHTAHFPHQRNDLDLSPVAVAFAAREGLPSAYTPISVVQLFRFASFYADFYAPSGPGHTHPDAATRSAHAARVRFNLETKILPLPDGGTAKPQGNEEPTTNHTVDPETFVRTLCGAITRARLESSCTVQSFDFRTLQLVEQRFPRIPTVYLTADSRQLFTDCVPTSLRLPATR